MAASEREVWHAKALEHLREAGEAQRDAATALKLAGVLIVCPSTLPVGPAVELHKVDLQAAAIAAANVDAPADVEASAERPRSRKPRSYPFGTGFGSGRISDDS